MLSGYITYGCVALCLFIIACLCIAIHKDLKNQQGIGEKYHRERIISNGELKYNGSVLAKYKYNEGVLDIVFRNQPYIHFSYLADSKYNIEDLVEVEVWRICREQILKLGAL